VIDLSFFLDTMNSVCIVWTAFLEQNTTMAEFKGNSLVQLDASREDNYRVVSVRALAARTTLVSEVAKVVTPFPLAAQLLTDQALSIAIELDVGRSDLLVLIGNLLRLKQGILPTEEKQVQQLYPRSLVQLLQAPLVDNMIGERGKLFTFLFNKLGNISFAQDQNSVE
jgi:hypothetical protein